MYVVLDPEPEIRGGGAGEAQYPKKFFWFGLKIGGGGAQPSRPLHHWYVCP